MALAGAVSGRSGQVAALAGDFVFQREGAASVAAVGRAESRALARRDAGNWLMVYDAPLLEECDVVHRRSRIVSH